MIDSNSTVSVVGCYSQTADPFQVKHQNEMFFNRVWRELKTAFPSWSQAFPTEQAELAAKRVWRMAFIENGIRTDEQIEIGLKLARRSDSPLFPSPGQFVRWCQPTLDMFGLPSESQAYRQALSLRPKHQVVKVAIKATQYQRGALSEELFRKSFSEAYSIACQQFMRGDAMFCDTSEKQGEPALPSCPVSRQVGLQIIAKLRKNLRKRGVPV